MTPLLSELHVYLSSSKFTFLANVDQDKVFVAFELLLNLLDRTMVDSSLCFRSDFKTEGNDFS